MNVNYTWIDIFVDRLIVISITVFSLVQHKQPSYFNHLIEEIANGN